IERKIRPQILRHNSRVVHAAFSPTGRDLLTSCSDDVIRLWHLPDRPLVSETNDWSLLNGTGVIDGSNGVWSLIHASGLRTPLLLSNETNIAFSFSSDERFFAARFPSDSSSNSAIGVRCFDAQTGNSHGASIIAPHSCSDLIISATGERIFAFGSSTGIIWNVSSGKRIHSFSNGCESACFSPNGALLARGSLNRVEVYEIDGNTTTLRCGYFHPTNGLVVSLEFDAAGKHLISSCWDDNLNPY